MPLKAGANIVGLGLGDGIEIDSPTISRRHARIVIRESATLEDLGSKNGTWLAGERFAQWHSDGTEVTNSLFPPATGNVCFGVWEKVGPSRYTLNHFGFAFDANGV